jgi:hypothetical protein
MSLVCCGQALSLFSEKSPLSFANEQRMNVNLIWISAESRLVRGPQKALGSNLCTQAHRVGGVVDGARLVLNHAAEHAASNMKTRGENIY